MPGNDDHERRRPTFNDDLAVVVHDDHDRSGDIDDQRADDDYDRVALAAWASHAPAPEHVYVVPDDFFDGLLDDFEHDRRRDLKYERENPAD